MSNIEGLLERAELEEFSKKMREVGKKIVTTNGCFDILHVGHVRILKESRKLGDLLLVGINSDASVRRLKGPDRPINSAENRAEILLSLQCVDYVTIFDEATPVEFLSLVKPDIHVKGADYKPEDLEETPVVEAGGGKVHILALVPGHSTTSLVQKIKSD
ncbi:MAG TPA: D-glycero-beta-D-manno-heptose 1-phosphate adenylyltransferase [Candidatus Melainabacteria bacterium]|nr:D-glycero-beta-D-manno-heptose 1-phosphate adenylyltransferase [Candidatus Melainabacteria bacterium]HMP53862.1 D-glycero-beta-D-manno-heptose 1-phosphate adenylyltransferase [Candidatus Melainabacteria bacterium]